MILSVTLNPSVDRTVYVDGLKPFDANRVSKTEMDAGGKGLNLSRVAHECGAITKALAFLGGEPAELIRNVLNKEGVPFEEVSTSGSTRLNFSIEDGSEQPPTTFNERGPEVSPQERARFYDAFRNELPRAEWVAIGGSLPPGMGPQDYVELSTEAKASGAKVLIDADGEALRASIETLPDLIKPNREEVSRLLGRPVRSLIEAAEAARELYEKGISHVLVSMGSLGVAYHGLDGAWFGIAPQIEACSTIGSGDSLLGGFLAKLTIGGSIEDSLRLGVACGAATATTSGAEIARMPVIEQLLNGVKIERP